MRRNKVVKKIIVAVAAVAMAFTVIPGGHASPRAGTDLTMDDYDEILSRYVVDDSVPDYNDYVAQFDAKYPNSTIVINADQCSRYDENDMSAEPVYAYDYEGKEGKSLYTTENSLAEFDFEVEEEGFYNISIQYYPVEGKNSSIERSIFIDGALPYKEMSLITFSRIWKFDVANSGTTASGSSSYIWEVDNQGNDCKPEMIETREWMDSTVYDSDGYITSPLKIYLTKGLHSILLLK